MSVYAVADLHGMLELYKKIKDFIKPEDVVYFLGDAGDRGTNCWETVKAIMNDEQFICLKGNHEDMLIRAMESWFRYPEDEKKLSYYSSDVVLLTRNGGLNTFAEWARERPKERSRWYSRIKSLPTFLTYKNKDNKWIYMSHAGWSPCAYDDIPKDEDLIWDRDHYLYAWPEEAPDDIIILHGHTPIFYVIVDRQRYSRTPLKMPKLPCAYWYSNNHKCCIDNAAFYTKSTVLLDLDTFEEHKFYTDDYDPDVELF